MCYSLDTNAELLDSRAAFLDELVHLRLPPLKSGQHLSHESVASLTEPILYYTILYYTIRYDTML